MAFIASNCEKEKKKKKRGKINQGTMEEERQKGKRKLSKQWLAGKMSNWAFHTSAGHPLMCNTWFPPPHFSHSSCLAFTRSYSSPWEAVTAY